jgi:hypothetical protein
MSQSAPKTMPSLERSKEYGSECYWAGLVGALLAVVLVASAVGTETREPARGASGVVRQAAR